MKLMENLMTDHPVVVVRIQNRPVAAARVLTLARHHVTLVHDVERLHVTTVIQETLVAPLTDTWQKKIVRYTAGVALGRHLHLLSLIIIFKTSRIRRRIFTFQNWF